MYSRWFNKTLQLPNRHASARLPGICRPSGVIKITRPKRQPKSLEGQRRSRNQDPLGGFLFGAREALFRLAQSLAEKLDRYQRGNESGG
jgi:hypothetical protein